jgi:hypothetical protein
MLTGASQAAAQLTQMVYQPYCTREYGYEVIRIAGLYHQWNVTYNYPSLKRSS